MCRWLRGIIHATRRVRGQLATTPLSPRAPRRRRRAVLVPRLAAPRRAVQLRAVRLRVQLRALLLLLRRHP